MTIPTLLILGPSNAGKTPVGHALEQHRQATGRRALHLDFGEHLRQCCAGAIDPGFTDEQRTLIETFMQGRLLDSDSSFVAEHIVRWFLQHRHFDPRQDLLVLNGLPRNTDQARALDPIGVEVRRVLHLDCSIETAWQRKLRSDSGTGFEDRSGRTDSSYEIFRRKSESYLVDTLPLIDYYRDAGTPIVRVPVEIDTSPGDVVAAAGKCGLMIHPDNCAVCLPATRPGDD